MTTYSLEKRVKLMWVPTITAIAAPTVAEVGAGTDITPFLPPDGFDPGLTTNAVDDSDLITGVDRSVPGSVGATVTLKGKRHIATADDDFWTLAERDEEGYLVYRAGELYTAAFAAGQEVLVIKGILGDPQPMATAKNALDVFTVPVFTQDLAVKAIIAA